MSSTPSFSDIMFGHVAAQHVRVRTQPYRGHSPASAITKIELGKEYEASVVIGIAGMTAGEQLREAVKVGQQIITQATRLLTTLEPDDIDQVNAALDPEPAACRECGQPLAKPGLCRGCAREAVA